MRHTVTGSRASLTRSRADPLESTGVANALTRVDGAVNPPVRGHRPGGQTTGPTIREAVSLAAAFRSGSDVFVGEEVGE